MRPGRLRRALLGLLLLGFLAAGITLGVSDLRWRAHLGVVKAIGRLPEVPWAEVIPMLRGSRPPWLVSLFRTGNPYTSIQAPDPTDSLLTAGEVLYDTRCASCHGTGAAGGTGPALDDEEAAHGNSDWAVFRTMRQGISGTPMAPTGLGATDRWQIITYLRSRRAAARALAPPAPDPALVAMRPVTIEAVRAGRSEPSNWLSYSGAWDGQRHSPLDEINRTNVADLRLLWMYQVDIKGGLETTPLVVDGVMFLTTAESGVRALNAGTGELLWSWQPRLAERLSLCCGTPNRGVAILDTTLFVATLDARLVALNARTGRERWTVQVADPAEGYSFTSAPLVVPDLVVVGSAGGEFASQGFLDAYDPHSGERRWRFHTIPAPGEPGNDTWGGDSWKTGGGPAWVTGSYDPELDLVYWGIGNPNPDFNGDARPGDNLYTNSAVALDRKTGAMKWHFQFTPHDLQDMDAAQVPVLATGPDRTPLLLWANRNGFYYVLDRRTGRFLRGVQYAGQSWALGLDSVGRPKPRAGAAPSRAGTMLSPSSGATNWWSPSYSPRTGAFYVPVLELSAIFTKGEGDSRGLGRRMGSANRSADAAGGRGLIRAIDGLTGALRWEYVTFESWGRGGAAVGGILTTGGDLLFSSARDRIVALDAVDGKLLWNFRAGELVRTAPIAYRVGGREQITTSAGQVVLTFGLRR